MKLALLVAYVLAGALLALGALSMDRKAQSADVAVGGAIVMLAGLSVGALATIATVVYLIWSA